MVYFNTTVMMTPYVNLFSHLCVNLDQLPTFNSNKLPACSIFITSVVLIGGVFVSARSLTPTR